MTRCALQYPIATSNLKTEKHGFMSTVMCAAEKKVSVEQCTAVRMHLMRAKESCLRVEV